MKEKKTVNQYKSSLKKSVGAGMGALFNGNGRRYYILNHRSASKYHKAGESQEIIVDQAILGCSEECQVRFDQETWGIVSRRHAAIERDGNRWKLIHLSTVNSTFVNGKKVETERHLENGDEIQLAVGGPIMGFIVPEGKQGLVSSIRLTKRLELFREQALRPYKRAIAVMAVALAVAVGGLGAWNWNLHNDLVEKGVELAKQYDLLKENKAKADSLEMLIAENNKLIDGYELRLKELRDQAAAAMSAAKKARLEIGNITGITAGDKLKALYPSVYFVHVTLNNVYDKDGKPMSYVGTAFLLDDGKLVTAQHMVDFWSRVTTYKSYITGEYEISWDDDKTEINRIAHNEHPIDVTWDAYSPAGDHIQYHYTSENVPFTVGNSKKKRGVFPDPKKEGISWILENKLTQDQTDWAFIATGKKGVIKADRNKAANLGAKTPLDILGYPYGRGAENIEKPTPIYTQSTVARDGLDVNGTIMLSNEDTQGGNSGGPVFIKIENDYRVIGILSGSTIGKDRVVPINQIR